MEVQSKKRGEDLRAERKAHKKTLQRFAKERLLLENRILASESHVIPEKNRQVIDIRVFSVVLVLQSMISFRSTPIIIKSFIEKGFDAIKWVPHFTSVINWTLRMGLGLLSCITSIKEPWIAIVDFSFDKGMTKILLILRVKLHVLGNKGAALSAEDCECIGLHVGNQWKGADVHKALTKTFSQSGRPTAILKDQGSDLGLGVRLLNESGSKIHIIDDVTHVVANALKKDFGKRKIFSKFMEVVSVGAERLRQTRYSAFIPPSLRKKGRFQSIARLISWAQDLIPFFEGQGRHARGSLKEKLFKAFPRFLMFKAFIKEFFNTTAVTDEFQKILKHEGLNQRVYQEAKNILERLPEKSKTRIILQKWLRKHIRVQCILSMAQTPLPVSSDIIESLFGKFKVLLQKHPRSDLNRMALAIPTICGRRSEEDLSKALDSISHKTLKQWELQNIPMTHRRARTLAFLSKKHVKKLGIKSGDG